MIMCVSIVVEFQSTLPRRERRGKFLSFDGCGYISIHAPAKGATTSMGQAASTSIFQSTLPRRERLSGTSKTIEWATISIHAPAKGATTNPELFK